MLGKGQLTYAHGDVYRGEWFNDEATGVGKLVMHSGDHYKGQFKQGCMNGSGEYTFHAGGKYIGDFFDGEFRWAKMDHFFWRFSYSSSPTLSIYND